MLILRRKLGEKIYIGENVCITVVAIHGGTVRLAIDAPRDVPIFRQELLPLKDAGLNVPVSSARVRPPDAPPLGGK
jgi:carbon storage regulator